MKRVGVIDYGMGNLDSVARAIQECGGHPVVTASPEELRGVSLLVLPGVGGFRDGIVNVRQRGLDELVNEQVHQGIPLLGLCLGMQLLADAGTEGGAHAGLGLIPGTIQRIERVTAETRVPHVGWNEVRHDGRSPLFEGVPSGKDFYFVHSYHFVPSDPDSVLACTPYAGGIVSALGRDHVYGLQFHPEKSQRAGFQVLRNFLSL